MIPQYTKSEIMDALYGNRIRCCLCKFRDFPVGKVPDGFLSKCKRLDHNIVRFAPSIFSGHHMDYNQSICRDFQPNRTYKLLYENWTCYDDYFNYFVKVNGHKPYGKYSLIVNADYETYYDMKGDDFVNGHIFRDDGKLNVCSQRYMKKYKQVDELGTHIFQKIVYENVDGLDITKYIKGNEYYHIGGEND